MRAKTSKKSVEEMTWYFPARAKLKYIRDIAICNQNMATKRVKESNFKGWSIVSKPFISLSDQFQAFAA